MEWLLLVLGVALGFGAERVYETVKPRVYLRKLRHVLPVSSRNQTLEIFIRPSLEVQAAGSGGKSKRAYTHSCETISLQFLSRVLHETPVTLKFRYDDAVDDPFADWIILGLSRSKSKISQNVLDRIESSLKISVVKVAGSHQYFRAEGGQEFHCSHVEDLHFETRVTRDYGLIYRAVHDRGNMTLLCGGVHMHGTQAAVQVALSDAFVDRVIRSGAAEFAQLVEVSVNPDGLTIDPMTIRWRDLPFMVIEPRKDEWAPGRRAGEFREVAETLAGTPVAIRPPDDTP